MSFRKSLISWILLFIIIVIGFSFQNNSVRADNSTINNSTLFTFNNGPVYVNNTATVYANYSYENGTISGIDVCLFNNIYMNFNMSSGIYYYNIIYSEPGNYSYEVNCYITGYENLTEFGNIEIIPIENPIIIDEDNDSYSVEEDCDDNNPDINPGQDEILYNEIDDDCNPSTLDYLIFELSTDKTIYEPQETVDIIINARNGSDTYITINTPTNVSYVYIFSNGSYPVTQEFSLTSLSGQYSVEGVNYFETYTNSENVEFSIDNNFGAEIQTDKNTVYTGEDIHFEVSFSGAIGQVNMIWNMDDGNEKYVQEFDYIYTNPGTYNIVLMATDEGGNQLMKTKQIIVKKQYFLKVKVVDNKTNDLIKDAVVELDNFEKDVNNSAMAEYNVTNKTYDLEVRAEDYYTYDKEIKITQSLVLTIKLNERTENLPPLITINSPSNGSTINNPEFKFKFSDDSKSFCTLFISEGDGWWTDLQTKENLTQNKQYVFNPDLSEGDYYWKILCTDIDDNVGASSTYVVTIGQNSQETVTTDNPETTYNVIQNVYDVIPDFETYSPDEKKIIEYLEMDVLIKDAMRKLEMANRDLFNIRNEPDTDSVIRKRDEIYDRIDDIKDNTPLSVSAKDKVEFVKYVDDVELQELFEEYVSLKNIELSKKEKKALIELNKDLQKKTTIETKAYIVEIKYISGRSEEVTLITRKLDASSLQDTMYIEFIPKDLVENTDDIVFITQPDRILRKDPVFEKKASQLTDFVYYVNNKISLDTIPKIKPILFTTTVNEDSINSITGFAIFDNLGFSASNKKIFIFEIIVVFILLGVYLFYYFRSSKDAMIVESEEPVQQVFDEEVVQQPVIQENLQAKDHHKIGYIRQVVRQTSNLLKNNNLKKAALKYHEVKFLYDLLSEEDKKIVFSDVIHIADELNLASVKDLIDKAMIELAHSNFEHAHTLYEEIQNEYEKLSEDYQELIYPRCCEIALHLKNG